MLVRFKKFQVSEISVNSSVVAWYSLPVENNSSTAIHMAENQRPHRLAGSDVVGPELKKRLIFLKFGEFG
jgi:hypothetical protein